MTDSRAALLHTIRTDPDLINVVDAYRELAADLRGHLAQLDNDLTTAVAAMRQRHASWAEIAKPLDITRQAAQQRYGDRREAVLEDLSPYTATPTAS
jgi:hypothetical protein